MKLWDDEEETEEEKEPENNVKSTLKDAMQQSFTGNIANNNTSGKRKYVAPTKEEFEECLETTGLNWEIEDDESSKEYVYEAYGLLPNYENIVLRIYSTIDERTDRAREKGNDAIRLVIWDKQTNAPLGGKKKTLRIETYCKNLVKKVKELHNETSQFVTECDNCGSFMVKRDGQYGEFYGCRSYPDCENTKQIED